MSDLEFDRFIKKEFSALTLDKLRMLSEGAMFSYADLHKVYLLGKKSLRAEIERKDAVMRLVLDVLLYHRDDPDMIEWAEGKVLRTVSTEESIDDS